MRTIIALSTALLLTTAPAAQAQILGGGGGLGGTLGGSIGGTLGGTLGGAGGVGGTLDSVRSGTSGTLNSAGRGATSTTGSQSVDRKSGKVHANRSVSASGGGSVANAVSSPVSSLAGNASGSGSATGSGSADAQLVGTDAVRGTVQSARGTAQGAIQRVRDTAGGASGQGQGLISGAAGTLTGSLSGSGSASGVGSAGGASGPLGGSASGSGAADGGFTVTRGMPVLSPDGERIGKVRQVISNARGEAQQLLVKVDGQLATLPAANFSASGNAVMSAMGEGEIKQVGAEQEAAR